MSDADELMIAKAHLDRIERCRDDLQAIWEQQATDIADKRLTPKEADKLDYSELLTGISHALNGHFWELIADAEQAVYDIRNAIEQAEWDADDAAEAERLASENQTQKAA